eukprot:Clim_evm7s230 gene=Clim_evmTU7s230
MAGITRQDVEAWLRDHPEETEDVISNIGLRSQLNRAASNVGAGRSPMAGRQVGGRSDAWSAGINLTGVAQDVSSQGRLTTDKSSRGSNEDLISHFGAVTPEVQTDIRRTAGLTETAKDMLLDVISDITDELILTQLISKIFKNCLRLVACERCSVFLVEAGSKMLVSRVFDLTEDSNDIVNDNIRPNHTVRVPIGQGVIGYCASKGVMVNVPDAYQDDRFNRAVDEETGFKTHTLLSAPIRHADGQVIGVATLVNKTPVAETFTEEDEEIFEFYLRFCGVAIRNAQIFQMVSNAINRSNALQTMAKNIMTETNMNKLLDTIMSNSADLVGADRASVFLLDDERGELYARIFSVRKDGKLNDWEAAADGPTEVRFPMNKGIAGAVATTGQRLNIANAYQDERFNADVDKKTGYQTKSILCVPITNRDHKVIGVAQLVNKVDDNNNILEFDAEDESILSGFAIYCGLAIHNATTMQELGRELARGEVAEEQIQYYAQSDQKDLDRIARTEIHEDQYPSIHGFALETRSLTANQQVKFAMRTVDNLGFTAKFQVPPTVLARFFLAVMKNYRNVTYHNWSHGFSVGHFMYATIRNGGTCYPGFSDLERFALLIAAYCHDMDHRGTNNAYQLAANTPLSQLYPTNIMERHHVNMTMSILRHDDMDIFCGLNEADRKQALQIVEEAILATDLANYFKNRGKVQEMITAKELDLGNAEHRRLFRGMLMPACDLGEVAKPFPIQRSVAEVVYTEFFEQGDLEKEMGKTPMDIMNRDKVREVPKMQLGFIDFVCRPLYKLLSDYDNTVFGCLVERVDENRRLWEDMLGDPYRWTTEEKNPNAVAGATSAIRTDSRDTVYKSGRASTFEQQTDDQQRGGNVNTGSESVPMEVDLASKVRMVDSTSEGLGTRAKKSRVAPASPPTSAVVESDSREGQTSAADQQAEKKRSSFTSKLKKKVSR